MKTLLLAAVLGAFVGGALASSTGCVACDDSVCSSTLWIYFEEPDGKALRDGEYHLEITVDGEPDEATCIVADHGHALDCDGLKFVLYAPLYDSPDNPHEVFELYFEEDPPAEVVVRITHDGDTIFDDTIAPHYELAEPKCDDDCMHATKRFELAR